jgi:hypothetical protein
MIVQTIFVALLMLVLGLLFCFVGFRLFVILLPVFGFFAGFLITTQAIVEWFGGTFLALASAWVFGFVVGLLCAVVAYFFYYAAVGILAAAVGYELGVGLMAGFGVDSGFVQFLVGVVLATALVAAVILLNLPKVFIIILTAEAGATMILTGLLLAIGRIPLTALRWGVVGAFIRDSWFWFLVLLVITAAGVIAQLFVPSEFTLAPYDYEVARTSHITPNWVATSTPPTRSSEPAV